MFAATAPGSTAAAAASTQGVITSLTGFFTPSGYKFSVPSVEFRAAFPQLADAFEIGDSLSVKMSSLSIGGEKKRKKKTTSKKKLGHKKAGGLLDNYLQINKENEASKVVEEDELSWNSPDKETR